MSAARKYELVYLVAPETSDEQVAALHQQVEQIVQKFGGQLEKTENWGRRRLAYEIAHHKEAIYVLEVIVGAGDLMKELDRRLKVADEVIRHLAVRVDETERVAARVRSIREATTARRRQARGLPPTIQPGEGPRGDDADELAGELEVER